MSAMTLVCDVSRNRLEWLQQRLEADARTPTVASVSWRSGVGAAE